MAYIDFWRRWKDFSGKTSRYEYWMALFTHILLSFILMIAILIFLAAALDLPTEEGLRWFEIMWSLYGITWIVPFLAMSVRRIRDAGFHKKNAWALLIPGIAVIALSLPTFDKQNNMKTE